MIKNIKMQLGFEVDENAQTKLKKYSVTNVSREASDENLRIVANAIYQLIDGSPVETLKIIETTVN